MSKFIDQFLDTIVVFALLAVMLIWNKSSETERGGIVAYGNASRKVYEPASLKIEGCRFIDTTASTAPNLTHTVTYEPENATPQGDLTHWGQ